MSDALRVLIVEDSTTDAKLVVQALRQVKPVIEFERVEDPVAMREALLSKEWHLVVSDWSIPRFGALAALEVLQDCGLDLPFIIVSGTVGEEAAVEAMRAGARDYVLKDKLARLAPAVTRELAEHGQRHARRRAEERTRAQEARFRGLIENSQDGIMLVGREGSVQYMSPAAERIMGVRAEEMRGQRVFEMLHPDDRARAREELADVVGRPGACITSELRVARPNGEVRWIESTRTNMTHDPAIAAVVGNFRDITDRKRALEDLRVSEARFARLAESGIVGIVVADLAGNTIDANDAYLNMFGYTREEMLRGDIHWPSMTPDEWHALDAVALTELKARGFAKPWEKELLRKDGARVPVLLGVAMIDESLCITFIADLTERKRAEQALRDSEMQLRQAQKMEAIGLLAGGIAHDFNNVLSVILSYSELLLDELKPSDPMRADVEEIRKAGKRAGDLTRQLLMFSRQQVLEPRVLDLNDLLLSLDKMLRRLVGEDVELVSTAAPSLGRVRADAGSIEQVVMNLVVNARDAMPTGGRVTMETANVVLDEAYAALHHGVVPGAYVMLAVTDNGIGMDRATQSRIFEPFFTTKDKSKGTGLGLSTVFGIVQQSGGYVWVYSEPGHGTTFKIYLPRVDAELDSSRPPPSATSLRGAETILLVEDEEPVRVVVRGILRKHGYHVFDARNAGEALLTCEKHGDDIALLLTDVVMPQMSGPELAKRLQAAFPKLKVLCMSGYTDDAALRHGVIESGVAYLQKPVTVDSLTRKVREVLDSNGAR